MAELLGEGSARKGLTPGKTGLTGKALRVPSRFAKTPGVSRAAEAPGAAVPPPTTKFAGILKKLTFSAAKPQATLGRGPAAAEEAEARGGRQEAGPAAPSLHPTTTTKQLRFDASATPAAAAASAGPARHVRLGAGTVSPAARGAGGPARRQSAVSFRTPEGAIPEEGGTPVHGATNSTNAGRTPYDGRMSTLFQKYGRGAAAAAAGGVTPEVAAGLQEGEVTDEELAGEEGSVRGGEERFM